MDNQDSGGILSKFRQRLRKIRLARSKRKIDNQKFIDDKVKEIRTTIRGENSKPYLIKKVSNYRMKDSKKIDLSKNYVSKKISIVNDKDKPLNFNIRKKNVSSQKLEVNNDKKNIENKVKTIHQEKEFIPKRKKAFVSEKQVKQSASSISNKENIEYLGKEIILKLKDSFETKLDELEVLQSELYFLTKEQEKEIELKKVKELKERISIIVDQLNSLIEQYNIYNDNYYIDYVIGIDDNVIVDDIINYREMLDSFRDEKNFVKEYKNLEEFKRLYSNLKEIKAKTENVIQDNQRKIDEFNIRDKKYDEIKLGVVKVQDIDKNCSLEIERQNEYFSKLMEKVNKINKEEYSTYHLRGVGDLVRNSLKYVGFMMLSPLSGLLPNIAMNTLMTRRLIHNSYHNMKFEEVKHVHYATINYDSELNHHLCDVDYVDALLDDTLKDISKLKDNFMLQYNSKIPGYDDTLKNIKKIEEKVIRNQNRVSIIRNNLKTSKKLNENKMIYVRKLNEGKTDSNFEK